MAATKTDILVYAHWVGMPNPKLIGVLSAQQAKGKKAFSFEYANDWIQSTEQLLLDPDIGWFKGQQYPNNKENFGIFFDSMPDTWGKTLMKRRFAQQVKKEGKPSSIAISNTDDHLRNHGFLLTKQGWLLSPAYDINPSTEKNGLALNIDIDNNALEKV